MANFYQTTWFHNVLDLYDPGGLRGGLSIAQLHQLQHGVLIEPLDYLQLEESFRALLPSREMVSPHFPGQLFCPSFRVLDVLMDLERRRKLTTQIWWDFCSLDSDGDFALTLSQSLTLAKLTLGDKFSENAWREFIFSKTRGGSSSKNLKICFEDIRPWLCGASPTGEAWRNDRLGDAIRQMREDELEEDVEEFWRLRELGTSKKTKTRVVEEREAGRRSAMRKEPVSRFAPALTTTDDITERLLREKYQLIVHRLSRACQTMREPAERNIDIAILHEVISDAVFAENESRMDSLDGLKFDFTLLQLMGEEISAHSKRENSLLLKGTEYISGGWATHEVDSMLETEYAVLWKGQSTVPELVRDLKWRFQEEKRRLVSSVEKSQPLELLNQVLKLQEATPLATVDAFKFALIVAGLTERPQQFPKWGPNFDASRLVEAGKLLLLAEEDGVGEKFQVFTLTDVKEAFFRKSGELLALVRARHKGEMRLLKSHLVLKEDLGDSDAKDIIYFLRDCFSSAFPNFEENSKNEDAPIEYVKLGDGEVMHKITKEGIGAFLKLKRMLYQFTPSGETDCYGAVVADLLQRQIHEERNVLSFCLKSSAEKDLFRIDGRIGEEKENATSLNNVAHVILSLTPCDVDDAYLFSSLREKFSILRDKCLIQLLTWGGKKLDGDALDELKERENLLRRMADEEGLKKLEMQYRDLDEQIFSVDTMLGSQHSSIECSLADNALGEEGSDSLAISRNCLLKDLAIRSEREKETLTMALYSKRRVKPVLRFDKVRQNALASRANRVGELSFGFDQAALIMGLNDRLCHVADCDGRSAVDAERIVRLAETFVTNEVPDSKKKELPKKLPKPSGSETVSWIIHVHDQYHCMEQNVLRGILLDPSLNELLELTKDWDDQDVSERLRELELAASQLEVEHGDRRQETQEQNRRMHEGFLEIFEEAVASQLTKDTRRGLSQTTVTGKLVERLLLIQDAEIGEVVFVLWKSYSDLYSMGKKVESRRYFFSNVRKVLFTRPDDDADQGVVGELARDVEKYYDDSRDRLLLELLKKQLGDKQWQEMNEKERQRLLALLRLKEKQMRKQGRYDEFMSMLNQSDALEKMLQDSRSRSAAQLKKRLRDLKEKRQTGPDLSDTEAIAGGLLSMAEEEETVKNVLKYDPTADLKLVEGLIEGMSMARWNSLSEAERQKLILEEKLKNLLARKQERQHKAAEILNRVMRDDSELRRIFDATKSKQRADLIARLENAKKKRLKANEVQPSEEELELSSAIEDLEEDEELDNSLKDRLFAESLIAQLSLAEWNKLSEMERQQKILELKKKERKLRKEGRLEEANRLIQEAFASVSRHDTVSAEQRDEQKAKIRERIAKARSKKLDDADADSVSGLESVVDTTSEVLELLDDKYAALKDKLFDEISKSALHNLSEAERQRKLFELKKSQKQLRQSGLHQEAENMMREFLGNDALLKQLADGEKEKRLASLKRRVESIRQKNGGKSSEEETSLEKEIEVLSNSKFDDPFSLFDKDLESEKAAILGQFLQWQSQESTEKLRQLQAVKLRLDKKRISQEENYEAASQIFDLMRQNQSAQDFDSERQRKLAQARIAARQATRQSSKSELDLKDVSSFPSGETSKESLILTVDQRHHDECSKLVQFFQSEASTLSKSEMEKRFNDLMDLRSSWLSHWSDQPMENDSISEDELQVLHEQLDILMELTAISRAVMSVESADEDNAKTSLLTKLQEIQVTERNDMLSKSLVTDEDLDLERRKLKYSRYDNIAKAIDFYTDTIKVPIKEQDEISAELAQKYDAMKDIMVMEGLMKQHGEAEWSKMTERERQAKLLKVRIQERRFRQEGKLIEAAALLNKLTSETEMAKRVMQKSMNDQKSNTKDRIRRRLELKKERQKQGKDTSDVALDVVLDMEEAEKGKSSSQIQDVASAMEANYEEERKAIMATLKSKSDKVSADKVRQLEVAKMRIAKAKLKREGKFDAAAMILEKAKLAEKAKTDSFTNEQDRQRKLAQDRFLKLRERKMAKKNADGSTAVADPVNLQESVLRALDEKQQRQSAYLGDLVTDINLERLSEVENRSLADLKESLKSFSVEYDQWKERQGSDDELIAILKSAAFYKVAELMAIDGGVASLEGATSTLAAALQVKQSSEQRTLEQVMVRSDVNDEELLKFYERNNGASWRDDVASILLTPDAAGPPAKTDNLMRELNEEFEKERKQLRDTVGSEQVDYDSEMKKLEEQYAAKRRATQAAFSRQRSAALQKIAAKKAARERKDNDAEAAALMVAALKEEQRRVFEQQKSGKDKQRALMQSRLAARKRARELERTESAKYPESDERAEEDADERMEGTNVSDEAPLPVAEDSDDSEAFPTEALPTPANEDIASTLNQSVEVLKLETEGSFASIGSNDSGDLSSAFEDVKQKRGITVRKPDDTITSENEQAILSKLEREQTTIQMRTIKEIQQSKQRLNQRLERLKREREKKGELQDKAKEILGLGERQKTMLETMREEERQRATTNVRERIEKVKTERTKTMKERRDNNAAQFREMVDPASLEGLTESEKMAKVAETLQERMLAQEKELREGKRKIMVPEADDVLIDTGSSKIDLEREEPPPALLSLPGDQDLNQSVRARPRSPRPFQEEKMKQLKERRLRKKEERAKSAERGHLEDGSDGR